MTDLPVWAHFVGPIVLVMASVETGYRVGISALHRAADEKELPVSSMTGAVLGLTAFILAFTFGMVANRFEKRMDLVRQEANAIGTAYLRTDFLPEPDRTEARKYYKDYLRLRVAAVTSGKATQEEISKFLSETSRLQNALWAMGVAHAQKDTHSETTALYVAALNEVIDVHSLRLAVGFQVRVPIGIWLVLYCITCLSMMGVGYQTGIAGSKRSLVQPIMVVSFALVFFLIAVLDNPSTRVITVPQQPLIDLLDSLNV